MARVRRVRVLGLGNPILGDDAVGLHVARAVAKEIERQGLGDLVEVREICAGGIDLLLETEKGRQTA